MISINDEFLLGSFWNPFCTYKDRIYITCIKYISCSRSICTNHFINDQMVIVVLVRATLWVSGKKYIQNYTNRRWNNIFILPFFDLFYHMSTTFVGQRRVRLVRSIIWLIIRLEHMYMHKRTYHQTNIFYYQLLNYFKLTFKICTSFITNIKVSWK